jgi:succinate dehydrogenase/fumarate reductase cytochrome b subunit
MVMVCLHAICGMMTVFTQGDGTRMDLYPNQNMRTVLQRLSAALIFPFLILHLYTFTLMNNSATSGKIIYVILLIIAEVLFFATVITHVSVSITKAFITLGILSSKELMDKIDKVIYIVNAVVFVIAVVVIVRGQIIMFLS